MLDSYPGERMAVGETWVPDDERLARYVRPDELNLTFNFQLVEAPWGCPTRSTRPSSSPIDAMSGVGAPCTWVLDNHDVDRAATRYGGGALGLARARAAALVQLSLPGAAYIYNGDELGLENAELPDDALQGSDLAAERAHRSGPRRRAGCRCRGRVRGAAVRVDHERTSRTWLPMPEGWGRSGRSRPRSRAIRPRRCTCTGARWRCGTALPELTRAELEWSDAPQSVAWPITVAG